jgi:hypothetical protein
MVDLGRRNDNTKLLDMSPASSLSHIVDAFISWWFYPDRSVFIISGHFKCHKFFRKMKNMAKFFFHGCLALQQAGLDKIAGRF